MVLANFFNLAAVRPASRNVIVVVIKGADECGVVRTVLSEFRFMSLRMIPIRRLRLACAIGEANLDRDLPLGHQRRQHPHRQQVERRMTYRFHVHRLALELEVAHQHAVPQPQRLMNVRQVARRRPLAVGLRQPKADLAQMQPMRIGSQPRDFRRSGCRAGCRRSQPYARGRQTP